VFVGYARHGGGVAANARQLSVQLGIHETTGTEGPTGIFDKAENEAENLAQKDPNLADKGVNELGQEVNQMTGDRFGNQINEGEQAVESRFTQQGRGQGQGQGQGGYQDPNQGGYGQGQGQGGYQDPNQGGGYQDPNQGGYDPNQGGYDPNQGQDQDQG
jgi:hypothetical protein